MPSSKSRSRSKSSRREHQKRDRRSNSESRDRNRESRQRRRSNSRDRGERLRERRSRDRSSSQRKQPRQEEKITKNAKLFITNIDGKIAEDEVKDDLRKEFEKFGKIKELIVKIKLNSTNTYAFIEFEDVEDAAKAVEEMKDKHFKGKDLKVEFGKSERKQTDRQSGGCYNCHRDGHYARECTERNRRDRHGKLFLISDRYERRRSHSRDHDRYRRRRYSDSRSSSSDSYRRRSRKRTSRSRSQDYRRRDNDRYGRDRERVRERSSRYN